MPQQLTCFFMQIKESIARPLPHVVEERVVDLHLASTPSTPKSRSATLQITSNGNNNKPGNAYVHTNIHMKLIIVVKCMMYVL